MNGQHRDSQGFYRILQLKPGATINEIQLAYERIEEMPQSERGAAWGEIIRAYTVLRNPDMRRTYDHVETQPLPERRQYRPLNDVRLLAACGVLLVAIVGFVWAPLYGSRLRSFTPGDALVTTAGEPFGKVVETSERHTFATGLSSPAYLVAVHGTGELRWYPMNDIKSLCRKQR